MPFKRFEFRADASESILLGAGILATATYCSRFGCSVISTRVRCERFGALNEHFDAMAREPGRIVNKANALPFGTSLAVHERAEVREQLLRDFRPVVRRKEERHERQRVEGCSRGRTRLGTDC